jgi:hypothetical protein
MSVNFQNVKTFIPLYTDGVIFFFFFLICCVDHPMHSIGY